jgi:glycosyltransferase involved in cell wall biosynthesis
MHIPAKIFSLNERLLPRRQHFPSGGRARKALLAYQRVPRAPLPGYFEYSHNNKLTAKLLIEGLNELGFTVDVIDWQDATPAGEGAYDLVLSHGPKYFEHIRALKPGGVKLLLVTGANPTFGNAAQQERERLLRTRRQVPFEPRPLNLVTYLEPALEDADHVLLIGNGWTRSTYEARTQAKMRTIPNVSPFPARKRARRPGNRFIFFSSVGQVHRGLDLVLEAFQNFNAELTVASHYEEEPDFCGIYQKELFCSPNIRPVGLLRTHTSRFMKIASQADFCVLPSCSEGQSGSLLNLMALGIVPIATKACGIDLSNIGFTIDEATPQGVLRACRQALDCPDLEAIQTRLQLAASAHNMEAVRQSTVQTIRELC